jgi:hypothetical protein
MEIISRKEAMERGLKYYFTGKPCKHGHIEKRHTKRKVCAGCDKYHKKVITERLKQQGKYYHGKPCDKGHTLKFSANRTCVECSANRLTEEERKEYKKKYYSKNYQKISEYNKKYEANNRELINRRRREWHANRSPELKEKHDKYLQQYRKDNKAKHAARNSRRRKAIELATPDWVNYQSIIDVYIQRENKSREDGIVYHVDHIAPLINNFVCGLHVPWNLQVITAKENMSKSNKLPPQEQLRFRA